MEINWIIEINIVFTIIEPAYNYICQNYPNLSKKFVYVPDPIEHFPKQFDNDIRGELRIRIA